MRHYTHEEYVVLEELSTIRHEYLDGEIYAMAGGTPDHAALAFEILSIIRPQLRPDCRGFTSDLRLRVEATGLSTYPDGTIVCGGTRRAADDHLAVTNPTLLVEITSNSTEEYDRGPKLQHYQTIPTLREVVIVSHRERRVSVHRRADAQEWTCTEARAGGFVTLESLGAIVRVDDLYRGRLEDAAAG